jgi:hypothetical protein
MKMYSFVFWFAAICTLGSNALAQEKTPEQQQQGFFKLKGIVSCDDVKQEDAVVRLYRGNLKVDSAYTEKGGKFSFVLLKDQEYTIEILQFGFEPSLVKVNTFRKKVDKENEKNNYNLTIEAELVPEIKNKEGRDEELDILDFPIAEIYYNGKEDTFINNTKYTKYIKSEIKKIRAASK